MFTFLIRKEKKEFFLSHGLLHRKKGPAVLWKNGNKEWWFEGQRHCYEYPAVEWSDGTKQWWVNGRLSRNDYLPAIEWKSGIKEWWFKGEQYGVELNGTREFFNYKQRLHNYGNLPAIKYSNGDEEWWVDGKRHREDGPAVTIGDKQFWFEYGVFIKCSLF